MALTGIDAPIFSVVQSACVIAIALSGKRAGAGAAAACAIIDNTSA
jgi:hypothetical protein